MTTPMQAIPFHVDISRVIDVLARQIYQSPLALLRENTQNAFDAILLRRHLGNTFAPQIDIAITPNEVRVQDNGIGMTPIELRTHFWSAGSSGKNTPEARAAGVVGTFGIGAMANFGIASILEVTTESAVTGERTQSRAERETLSVTEDCITMLLQPSQGSPGTTVLARMAHGKLINVPEAVAYVSEFLRFVDVPVRINDAPLSRESLVDAVKRPGGGWEEHFESRSLTGSLVADGVVVVTGVGEVWLLLRNVHLNGKEFAGTFVLREGVGQVRTFRSGFGLASVAVNSEYGFGGAADSPLLAPTAGREALATDSMQLLQQLVTEATTFASTVLGTRPESNNNTNFMRWVLQHGHPDLLGHLKVRVEPDARQVVLSSLRGPPDALPIAFYRGTDGSIIRSVASDESPLIVLSASQPRQKCELTYLNAFCRAEEIADRPTVLSRLTLADYSYAESAFVFRLASILRSDYFLDGHIVLGKISHNVPVAVETVGAAHTLVVNRSSDSVGVLLTLHDTDYHAFGSMVKDFVRTVIFPKISDLVPSSTRQGAEAFLKSIRQPKELFEYEVTDLADLSKIWADYLDGRLSLVEAATRSQVVASKNIQVVDQGNTRSMEDVAPDVLVNEQRLDSSSSDPLDAAPAITRLDVRASAKILTLPADRPSLKGYRTFLAITDKVRDEKGEFFLQPHRTSIVWGGQKAMLVFQHHSGEFGLYYELQTSRGIASTAGGGAMPTATLVFEDSVFIPIPESIQDAFIPTADERKRFEVRCDLLYADLTAPGSDIAATT